MTPAEMLFLREAAVSAGTPLGEWSEERDAEFFAMLVARGEVCDRVPALCDQLARTRAALRAVLDMANSRLEEPEEEEWQALALLAEDLLA